MQYTQCMLEKGNMRQVSWIPSKFAVVNAILKLRDSEGIWEDGWKVTFAGTATDEKFVPDTHAAIKSHWKNTSGASPIGHK